MNTPTINILFLCTHNSARSILAEAALNHLAQVHGKNQFKGFSAGSSPRHNQQPNPMAIEVLDEAGYPTVELRSKNWDEFAGLDAPHMDLIITVCDDAAGEVCPIWPGHPATAHWSYVDPSAGDGTEAQKKHAFQQTLLSIHHRLELLLNLPYDKLHAMALQASARELAHP